MRLRKLIQRRIRGSADGVHVAGDVSAAIAANLGERSQTTHVSSRTSADSRQEDKAEGKDDTEPGR